MGDAVNRQPHVPWYIGGRRLGPGGGDERPRYRMRGPAAEQRHRPSFHDFPSGHYGDPPSHPRHGWEVVGDEQQPCPALPCQPCEQRQDLRFGHRIQRGGRLVGNDERRVERQRHGYGHALPLPAGKLVRVMAPGGEAAWQLHLRERGDGMVARLGQRQAAMQLEHLRHLVQHRLHRVERGHRLLEDEADFRAAQAAQPGLRCGGEVLALEQDAPLARRSLRQQPGNGKRGERFAGAGLTHQGQRLAGRKAEGNTVQQLPPTERDGEVVER